MNIREVNLSSGKWNNVIMDLRARLLETNLMEPRICKKKILCTKSDDNRKGWYFYKQPSLI